LVCVDYYGFNSRVLGLAKSAGVPAYYFISPQVWASRAGRMHVLKRLVRRMLVIFPFEERMYREAGVPCTFVGHPLLDLIPEPEPRAGLAPPFTVGLLPGSRASEVRRHLPVFLGALDRLRRRFPSTQARLFASPHLPDAAYAQAAGQAELVREEGYARRGGLDLALCSSGTATLENALLGVPMVVVYKMSWPTYAVARALIRVKHIAMAGLVPELIQDAATPQSVAAAALALLEDPGRHESLRQDLLALRRVLGEPGACARAAGEVLGSL
jgi:lipid-A-disaccharide synthase